MIFSPQTASVIISFLISFSFSCQKLEIASDTNQSSNVETFEVTVHYTGGPESCLNCLDNIGYARNYACGNGDNTWSSGNWSNGISYFDDPTPIDSLVVSVEVELWGTWSMEFLSIGTVEMDGFEVDSWAHSDREPCPNCPTPISLSSCVYNSGWPNYQYGGVNTLTVIPSFDQEVCLSKAVITLTALVAPPNISQLSPPLGPSDDKTLVAVVSESSFEGATNLRCRFGTNLVPAYRVTDFKAVCATPKGNASSYIPVSVTEDGQVFSESLSFYYYEQPAIDFIDPSFGTVEDDDGENPTVVITGTNFMNTSMFDCETNCLQCQWSLNETNPSTNETTLTAASFINTSAVQCQVPSLTKLLPTPESYAGSSYRIAAYVSVSQNAQVFTDETLKYVYVVKSPDWEHVLVVVVSVLCSIFILSGAILFALWRWWKDPNEESSSGYTRSEADHLLPEEHSQVISRYEEPLEDHIDPSSLENMVPIARGSFAMIYKAQWCGITVAVKRLPFSPPLSQNRLADLRREGELMRKLRHPNVLLYLGTCFPTPFDDLWLVMEFLSRGSLYTFIHSGKPIGLSLRKSICEDTAKGMLYLHKKDVIHRDLKSHNLLLDENWKVKVSDFGLSCTLRPSAPNSPACGTPSWSAPEVLRGGSCSSKADVFSFGIVLWELLTRKVPYEGMSCGEVIYGVSSQHMRPNFDPAHYPDISVGWWHLMQECWDEDPQARPPFEMILLRLEHLL